MNASSVVNWMIGILVVAIIIGAIFPTIVTQFAAVTGANGITSIFSVIAVIIAALVLWRIAGGAFNRGKNS